MPHPQPPPGVAPGAVALHLPATAPCKFAELSGRRRGRDGWWPWWAGSRRRRPRLSFPLFSWIFPYSCTPPPKTLRYGAPPPPGGGRNLQAVLPVWLWPAPTAGHHLLQAAAALYRDQPAGGLLPSCLSCSPTAPAWPPLCYSCWGGPSWTLPTAPPPPRGNIFDRKQP